jgi:hypothetical protein
LNLSRAAFLRQLALNHPARRQTPISGRFRDGLTDEEIRLVEEATA